MTFQSVFMSTTVHLFAARGVQRLVEAAEVRVAVVGVFAFGVGVVDDQPEAHAAGHRGPLQHFEVAVGIAEGRDRAAADMFIDADRLAGLVVDEVDLRQAEQHRPFRRASRTLS